MGVWKRDLVYFNELFFLSDYLIKLQKQSAHIAMIRD